jgi:hypothetical protein
MQMRRHVHFWRYIPRGLGSGLTVLVLGSATIAPVLAQGAWQLSGNWSTGPIVLALANSPDLSTLRAFPGPVLLPPASPPFAGLPLAPPRPEWPSALTADANCLLVEPWILPGSRRELGSRRHTR